MSSSTPTSLLHIQSLSQDMRLNAKETARLSVVKSVGDRPIRSQFETHTHTRYPSYVTGIILLLCVLALIAAFIPSAIRLYHIGSSTFGHTISHPLSMQIAGIAVVLMAEVSQLVFSLSLAVLGTSKTAKRLLYTSMGLATAIALTGNAQVALPEQWTNPFAWLEAICPPLLVLSLSYILKEQMLTSIEQRFATERAYEQAFTSWKSAISDAEQHPKWLQFYANALRDAIRDANKYRRNINLNDLSQEEWRWLVWREMQADTWYSHPINSIEGVETQLRNSLSGSNTHNPANEFSKERNEIVETLPAPLVESAISRMRTASD